MHKTEILPDPSSLTAQLLRYVLVFGNRRISSIATSLSACLIPKHA